MKEPDWLNSELVLNLHEYVINETGGSHGVRDEALLESALSRAQNVYYYEQADTFDIAATYAEAISSNHPFIDGNKRTAFVVADIFLKKNGYTLEVEKNNEQEILILNLAEKKISRTELAEWYRQNTQEHERQVELSNPREFIERERVHSQERQQSGGAEHLANVLGGPVTYAQIRDRASAEQQRAEQHVQNVAGQLKQVLTPEQREALVKEFDRAAAEARKASEAYREAARNARPGEARRAAMRAEYRADFAAKQAEREAARLRETDQQRQEREEREQEEERSRRKERERERGF